MTDKQEQRRTARKPNVMTNEETLKLALEALERVNNVDDDCDILSRDLANFVVDTIDAVKEALASEQEQRSDSEHTGEPVAMQMDVIVVNLVREGINKHRARELAEHFIKTATPQQLTWVGLSREDCYQVRENESDEFMYGVAWAEAKLKEKNT
jgi:hypothetical protein